MCCELTAPFSTEAGGRPPIPRTTSLKFAAPSHSTVFCQTLPAPHRAATRRAAPYYSHATRSNWSIYTTRPPHLTVHHSCVRRPTPSHPFPHRPAPPHRFPLRRYMPSHTYHFPLSHRLSYRFSTQEAAARSLGRLWAPTCVGFVQTLGCTPRGTPHASQACHTPIKSGWSGYCECRKTAYGQQHQQHQQEVTIRAGLVSCNHKEFTCEVECRRQYPGFHH